VHPPAHMCELCVSMSFVPVFSVHVLHNPRANARETPSLSVRWSINVLSLDHLLKTNLNSVVQRERCSGRTFAQLSIYQKV